MTTPRTDIIRRSRIGRCCKVASRYGDDRDMQYFAKRPDDGPLYVKYLGNGHTVVDQRPGMREGYWKWIRPFPGMEAFEASLRKRYGDKEAERLLDMGPGAGLNLNIFPNLLIIGNHLQIVEPLTVDSTALSWYGTTIEGVPDEINTMRMRMQEDFPAFGEPDDLANFEEAQRGMLIPEMEWIDISRGVGYRCEKTDHRGSGDRPCHPRASHPWLLPGVDSIDDGCDHRMVGRPR